MECVSPRWHFRRRVRTPGFNGSPPAEPVDRPGAFCVRRALVRVFLAAALGCAAAQGPQASAPNARSVERHYLRHMVFAGRGDTFLLHWGRRAMPLRVFLLAPPEGLFPDPEGIERTVRQAVLAWSDAAGPGLPAFEFVDSAGEADIPILWAETPSGDWAIAFCSYDLNLAQLRFGVSHVLVTGRWGKGGLADLESIHKVVLHEMGHALGLGGHSPDPRDILFRSIDSEASGLSAADRETLRRLYEHGPRRYSGRRSR